MTPKLMVKVTEDLALAGWINGDLRGTVALPLDELAHPWGRWSARLCQTLQDNVFVLQAVMRETPFDLVEGEVITFYKGPKLIAVLEVIKL